MERWTETAEGFLHTLDVSANSARTYKEALKTFYKWWSRAKRPPLTKETLRDYREWLKENRAVNTVLTYSVALGRFFKYAVQEGELNTNPLEGVKRLRRPQGHLRRDLSRNELRGVFEAIDRQTQIGKRDFAIVSLMARNGLRIIEVHRANYGDLEQRMGRKILRIWGKGRDERDEFVVLSQAAEEALMDYLDTRKTMKNNSPLFINESKKKGPGRKPQERISVRHIRRRVTHYFEQAGVKTSKTTVHSLRHSFVTLAIEGGASLMEAQAAARHRSIQTTMVYFHEHGRLDNPVEDRIQI